MLGIAFGNLTKVGDHRTAAATIRAFIGHWAKHYGWPEVLVSDGGKEFAAEFSQKLCSECGFHHMCDADSPWRNGHTERAGG